MSAGLNISVTTFMLLNSPSFVPYTTYTILVKDMGINSTDSCKLERVYIQVNLISFCVQLVKYCNPVQIRTRDLYSLKLDLNYYIQIRYNAVYSIAKTDRKTTFALFHLHFNSIGPKVLVEIIIIKVSPDCWQLNLQHVIAES